MSDNQQRFLFDGLELLIEIRDLLSAPVEVIVNPANGGLSHGGGLAGQIVLEGGDEIQEQSDALIATNGRLESGMAVFTSAGRLPYQAIIHAVGPFMGRGDEQEKIQTAVSNSLQLCANNKWHSIALPAISTGIFSVPVEICARAFVAAIATLLSDQAESLPDRIMICLMENHYPTFAQIFESRWPDQLASQRGAATIQPDTEASDESDSNQESGFVDLSDQDLDALDDDDEIGDWFD